MPRKASVSSSVKQRRQSVSKPGSNARSRAGCLTCKAKHTKCDETRPECRRCTDKGIKCGGYWKEFKWSFKHQPGVDVASTSSSSAQYATPEPGIQQQPPPPSTTATDDVDIFADLILTEDSAAGSPLSQFHGLAGLTPAAAPVTPAAPSIPAIPTAPLAVPVIPSEFDLNSDAEHILLPLQQRRLHQQRQQHHRPGEENPEDSSASSASSSSALTLAPETRRHVPPLGGWKQDLTSATFISTTGLFHPSTMPITDTTSLLITNWFEQVCPAWSGFDSKTNMNRRLALNLWQSSLSVQSSLQSMSAAFLSTRLPHMRRPALRCMQTATQVIQAEVQALKGQATLDTVPAGLLFALFCLGTTICWVDAGQLGIPYFREAKSLLRRLNQCFYTTNQHDTELLAFFNKSLTYYEMLLAVVDNPDSLNEPDAGTVWQPTRPAGPSLAEIVDNSLHPWTGISSLTSRLFADSVKLCRKHRQRLRQTVSADDDFESAMHDFQDAQNLEEQLLELEFPSFLPTAGTGDDQTPWAHLARVAEAYQLASLLQLYQTFPDLVSLRLPPDVNRPKAGQVSWEEWIIPLSLRLVWILGHIPPTSGSRMMSPLLYISASTGLRYDAASAGQTDSASNSRGGSTTSSLLFDELGLLQSPIWDDPTGDLGVFGDMFPSPNPTPMSFGLDSISKMSLEVSNARHFIMGRLGMLESSLPPRPVRMARKLIRAVWNAYDREPPGSQGVHWVDVMEANNLRSLFG